MPCWFHMYYGFFLLHTLQRSWLSLSHPNIDLASALITSPSGVAQSLFTAFHVLNGWGYPAVAWDLLCCRPRCLLHPLLPVTSIPAGASLQRAPWHILLGAGSPPCPPWLFPMHSLSADEFLSPSWLCCRSTSPSSPTGISLAPACQFLCCCLFSPHTLMITDTASCYFFLVEEPWIRENQIISAPRGPAMHLTDLKWIFCMWFSAQQAEVVGGNNGSESPAGKLAAWVMCEWQVWSKGDLACSDLAQEVGLYSLVSSYWEREGEK